MKIILLINDKEIELLDRDISFIEGEQVEINGYIHRVQSINKSISTVGNSADLAYIVRLL
jgi:hypothetical protein